MMARNNGRSCESYSRAIPALVMLTRIATAREELEIDVGSIVAKARCIALPTAANRAWLQQNLAESADFWGPVSLATAYSVLIVWGQFKVVPWVISVWVAGSLLVYTLGQSFGGGEGHQAGLAFIFAVLGYGLVPLIASAMILFVVPSMAFLIKSVGVLWSTGLSTVLICHGELESRKVMVFYPVGLTYYFLASLQSGV